MRLVKDNNSLFNGMEEPRGHAFAKASAGWLGSLWQGGSEIEYRFSKSSQIGRTNENEPFEKEIETNKYSKYPPVQIQSVAYPNPHP
jgi:hypothetical protein